MNRTSHGRWGRYKTINDQLHKLCNGPLHPPEGAFLPLDSFWKMKSGPRVGKPISRCIECERVYKGRNPKSGYVELSRVMFIFNELEIRIGRSEAARRMGVNPLGFWYKLDHQFYKHVQFSTVKRAMEVLYQARLDNEVRDPRSIRHGAAMRGRKERPRPAPKGPRISRDATIEDFATPSRVIPRSRYVND